MGHRVTLKASGKEFIVNTDETILEAALRQGINLPYGCKNGACGSCKGKVISGQVPASTAARQLLAAYQATGFPTN